MSSIPEARSSFNLKVLRRHDPSIVSIFETASFVVLYNYNNGEWTKTGVEGPLFLFRRRLPPYNGFFIMNRNGVENFSADVTPDDDLEITPDFIIYRPESNGDSEVYGIWVFEPGQRMAIGDKLLKLQQMEAPSEELVRVAEEASKSAVAGEGKQAVAAGGEAQKDAKGAAEGKNGKGKANGKPKKNAKQTAVLSEKDSTDEASARGTPVSSKDATTDSQSTQINLDDLFGSSASAPTQSPDAGSETQDSAAKSPSNGSSLLDSLFQNAVTLDNPLATTSATTEAPQASDAAATVTDHSQNLLALLGASNTPAPSASDESTLSSTTHAQPQTQQPEPESTSIGAPKMSDLLERGIHDRIGLGDDGQPLSRREFVTELLSMVHTNPEFVTDLYSSYLSRVS